MRRIAGTAALFALPITAGSLAPGSCRAQTIDYGAFEQLFGEPVTSSATGKPQRVSEAPANITIVTADQIARSGARTLPQALQYVAGIDVRQYGMQDAAVGIRGYNTPLNPRVLVLLDGRQVYQDDYGLTVWPTIPVALDEIRQIEIIKGPSAALYGFNAVSGVINIITRDPLREQQQVAAVQAGTQNQTYGDLVATAGGPGRWAVRLAAQGLRSTEFDGDEASIRRQQPHSGMVSADGRFAVSPAMEWDVFGALSSLDSAYYTDVGQSTPTAYRTNVLRTRLSYDAPVGLLRLDAYRNEDRVAVLFPGSALSYREDVVVVTLSDLIKVGAHAFRLAGEYRDNDAASFNTFRGHIGYEDGAASGMWEWTITPRVRLTNAVRVDAFFLRHEGTALPIPSLGTPVHDAGIVEPSFNSGLVLGLDDGNTVRLSAARASQLPSLLDFGLALVDGPILLSGNASLTPSEVTNYEVDWDRTLPALSSTLRLAVFAQHTQATIGAPFGSGLSILPTGQPLLLARNFGNSDEAGGEIGLTGQTGSGLRWNLSYALAAVRDRSADAVLSTAPSVSYQKQTPTNVVIAGLGYHWRRLDLDLQARWQSRFQDFRIDYASLATMPVTVSNYVTMRLHAAYQLTRTLTLSATADQLDRRQLPTTADVATDRQIVAGLRASF